MSVARRMHGVVDQLLGPHERPRFLGLTHSRRIFLGRPLGLADERDRRPRPIDRADVAVEERLHPQLEQEVVGHFAEDGRASALSGRRAPSGCGRRRTISNGTKYASSKSPSPRK